MLVFADEYVFSDGTTLVSSRWDQLDHSDFVEILGVRFALESDYDTASFIDNRVPVQAYFRMSDGNFALLSIAYHLNEADEV